MAKNVVIIESPGKIKKFKECLGKNYEVLSSVGHCVDLPVKKIGINIKNNFEPTWEVKEDSIETIDSIIKSCKKADNVYLMADEDREGCGISWHIYNQILGTCKGVIHRATTNQITKSSIQSAIENCGTVADDQNKINAYLARRILDRLVGYRTSYLTQQATGGRSAGRVQSVVLRVIVDREVEIVHFQPVEYWVLTAYLLTKKGEKYTAVLTEKIKVSNEDTATKIYDACVKSTPKVASVEAKEVSIKPYAPFITMPMVSTASSLFGWPAEKVMSTAQSLYSGGSITYHRTDSPFMAAEAVQEIRGHIGHEFGQTYLPNNPYVYTAKAGAQEAHECCRPTSIDESPHVSGDEAKLYKLIWKRAVASQMNPACDRRIKVITDIGGYDFITNGKIELFDGFRKCWDYGSSDDVVLPDLKKGDEVELDILEKEQKFTVPPPRYTDSSLAKLCDKNQITRPATVASVFKTLKDRKYVTKNKNTFHPTETGIAVVDFLKESDMCFVDVAFTAGMEALLDEIQGGKRTEVEVLTEFWERLQKDIESGKKIKEKNQKSTHKCPKCGGFLLKKHSKFGSFFSCENWKKKKKGEEESEGCDYIAKVGEHGEPIEKIAKVKEYAEFKCKKCKSKMVKRKSKKGEEFYGCENFSKTGCRCTANLEGVFGGSKTKKTWKKKKGS